MIQAGISLLPNSLYSDIVFFMPGRTKSKSTSASKKAPKKAPAKSVEKAMPVEHTSRAAKTSFNRQAIVETFKRPQVLIPSAILLAILAVFFFRSLFVVALVNGQFISRSSFESAMEQQAGKQTLNSLVTQKLLEQEAARKGISVPQSEIDAQAKKIDQQLASQGQTLDQALAARGMSRADFNEQLRLQSLLQKLLANDIKVSDKEVQDYIDKNKDSLPTGESDEQLKASVRSQLEQQKLSTAAQSLVQKLQSQAKITYFINL